MRWKSETSAAAEHLGWRVLETDGVGDWQGWGVHLLRRDDEWAVLGWSYGSCNVCDAYEGRLGEIGNDTPEQCAGVFGELIERCVDEAEARQRFSDRKGW